LLLSDALAAPKGPHRADYWEALASALGITIESIEPVRRMGRRILIHAGAGQPTRLWPRRRYDELASQLEKEGWQTEVLDDSFNGIAQLLDKLEGADRFIGNDSGPGHLAALLGVPTFTVFGPQLPEVFSPRHPEAAWIEGAPCAFKPCKDYCRFDEPRCITAIDTESVKRRVFAWLAA
jgi:ADP-heptose:LPS heptosyltransferase